MMIFLSYAKASSMAASSCSVLDTFEMPTLDPKFAGLTKTGSPSRLATSVRTPEVSAFHVRSRTTM